MFGDCLWKSSVAAKDSHANDFHFVDTALTATTTTMTTNNNKTTDKENLITHLFCIAKYISLYIVSLWSLCVVILRWNCFIFFAVVFALLCFVFYFCCCCCSYRRRTHIHTSPHNYPSNERGNGKNSRVKSIPQNVHTINLKQDEPLFCNARNDEFHQKISSIHSIIWNWIYNPIKCTVRVASTINLSLFPTYRIQIKNLFLFLYLSLSLSLSLVRFWLAFRNFFKYYSWHLFGAQASLINDVGLSVRIIETKDDTELNDIARSVCTNQFSFTLIYHFGFFTGNDSADLLTFNIASNFWFWFFIFVSNIWFTNTMYHVRIGNVFCLVIFNNTSEIKFDSYFGHNHINRTYTKRVSKFNQDENTTK